MNTDDFLSLIHGNTPVHFRMIQEGKKPFNKTGKYNEIESELEKYNNNGYDIYFVVNGGGTTSFDINKINAVFLDMDCGRDENEEYSKAEILKSGKKKYSYYPIHITKEYKEKSLYKIREFKHKPSLIVETRNGIHVYWLLNDGSSNEEFIECQNRLIQYFDGDSKVNTIERIMRLPNFYWNKKGYEKYKSSVIEYNDIRYDIKDIINDLPMLADDNAKELTIQKQNFVKPSINNIDLIINRDVEALKSRIFKLNNIIIEEVGVFDRKIEKNKNLILSFCPKPPTIENNRVQVYNREQLYYVIKCIDLFQFLGLNSSYFDCIFHPDTSNSASIFTTNEGHYLYKCHSDNCNFGIGTILKIVQRLQKCTIPQSIKFIKDVYNIDLIESEWQLEQKELLRENKRYFMSEEFELEEPDTYKRIKRYLPTINMIMDIAIDNVYDIPFGDSDRVTFFSGMSYFLKKLGKKNIDGLNKQINLFAFLELLDKLDESQIPEKYLKRSKHISAKNHHKNIVQYYSIPSYDSNHMTKVRQKAQLFEEKNMTMTGMSRELLLRTFGEDEADRVYPQSKGLQIPEENDEFATKFDITLLEIIRNQAYATEKECLEMLGANNKSNQRKCKKVLQETLDKYNLLRLRLNKDLKEQYNVTCNGYPYIIVENELEI